MESRPHRFRRKDLDSALTRQESSYRWIILGMVALTGFLAMGFQITAISVLLNEIANDLELSIFQTGVVLGMTALMGIFTAIISGPIIDSLGMARSIAAICLLVGISGALRGISNGFATLLFFSFLFGVFQPVVPVNLLKINRLWFRKDQLGLASGLMSSGFALGLMLGARLSASVLSPAFGGWQYVLVLLGTATVLLGIFWWVIYPQNESGLSNKFDIFVLFNQVADVAKFRALWVLGGAGLGITALMRGVVGYVPIYLRDQGWSAVDADSMVAVFFLASLLCVIPLSTVSDRITSRRTVIMFAIFMLTLGTSLLFVIKVSYLNVMVAMILAGCGFDAFMAIQGAMITEVEGIGASSMGAAIGLALTIRNIGPAIGPPVGNAFAAVGVTAPFLVWAAFGCLALVLMVGYVQNQR